MIGKILCVACLVLVPVLAVCIQTVPSEKVDRAAALVAGEMMGQWKNMHGDFWREVNRYR